MPFVVFEGIDGSGKSSLIQRLSEHLKSQGESVDCLREPGSTPLGERIRDLLLDPNVGSLTPWTEAALFTACRAEMVSRVIRPSLEAGRTVLLDRYFYSTLAYQGHGSGAGHEGLLGLSLEATGGLIPDRVFLLDLPVPESARRRDGATDRMEAKGNQFLQRVRDGFLAMAKEDPGLWRVLDAGRDRSQVFDEAWRAWPEG